jgi:hypothetical protein
MSRPRRNGLGLMDACVRDASPLGLVMWAGCIHLLHALVFFLPKGFAGQTFL